MAINLLSYLPTSPPSTGNTTMNTSTPANTNGSFTISPSQMTPNPMGVTAKSPATNVSGPANTLPSNQVATPGSFMIGANSGVKGGISAAPSTGSTMISPSQMTPNPAAPQAPVAPASTATTPQPYSSTNLPTTGGLLGQAANQATSLNNQANTINQTASQIGAETQMSPAEQQANANAAMLAGQQAAAINAIKQSGWSSLFQQGQEGAVQQNAAAQTAAQEAIAATYAAQRQANATALGAEAGAQNQAGGLLGTAAGALNTAASTSVSQPASYGQTVFNPVTGTYSGGASGVSPSDPFYATLQSYAQMAANGQVSAIPTSVTGNAVLNAQLNQMAKAINLNYNPITSAAQGAATAANVTTGGTTPTTTAATGYTNAVQNYNSANASYQTVTAQGNTLTQTMTSTGINSTPDFLSKPINQLANQMGSANYTSFAAALTETQQAYATLLGAVGAATPTINGQAATSLLTTSSTPAQITAALQQLQTAAYNKLAPMYQLIGTYQSQLSGNQNGTSNTNSNTNSSSLYNF